MKADPASDNHPQIYRFLFLSIAAIVAALSVAVWISDLQAHIGQQVKGLL